MIGEAAQGDLIGEMALLDDATRGATIYAARDSDVPACRVLRCSRWHGANPRPCSNSFVSCCDATPGRTPPSLHRSTP